VQIPVAHLQCAMQPTFLRAVHFMHHSKRNY
jgi:hypothetical protein